MGSEMCIRDRFAAVVEDFAVRVEHGGGDRAVAGVSCQHDLGNDVPVSEFDRVLASEEVVELDSHVNVALH